MTAPAPHPLAAALIAAARAGKLRARRDVRRVVGKVAPLPRAARKPVSR